MPEKKSDVETKRLEDSCVGSKKELSNGGFTCKDKDGNTITCIPNDDTTSNCWVTSSPPPTNVLEAFVEVQKALRVVEEALDKVISQDSDYK